jgi:hypothetical protein
MFLYLKFVILQKSLIKTKKYKRSNVLHSIVIRVKKIKSMVSSRFVINSGC